MFDDVLKATKECCAAFRSMQNGHPHVTCSVNTPDLSSTDAAHLSAQHITGRAGVLETETEIAELTTKQASHDQPVLETVLEKQTILAWIQRVNSMTSDYCNSNGFKAWRIMSLQLHRFEEPAMIKMSWHNNSNITVSPFSLRITPQSICKLRSLRLQTYSWGRLRTGFPTVLYNLQTQSIQNTQKKQNQKSRHNENGASW